MSDALININILPSCSNVCTLGVLKLAVIFIRVFSILTESSYNKIPCFYKSVSHHTVLMFIVVYTKIIRNILRLCMYVVQGC